MTIREKASQILDVMIPRGRPWASTINVIDSMGLISKRRQLELLIMLCEATEQLETRLDLLEAYNIKEKEDDKSNTTTTKFRAKTPVQSK